MRFTLEELNFLDAMLEVICDGGGTYSILQTPEIVATHRKIYEKIKASRMEMEMDKSIDKIRARIIAEDGPYA